MKKRAGQSLTKLADAAFEQAARQVIERARQTGTPIIVWEDEAVRAVEPTEFGPAAASKAKEKNGGKPRP